MSRTPTLLFVGVSTGRSAAPRMFPRWAELLGIVPAEVAGLDLPLDTAPERYREVAHQLRAGDYLRGALITSHKLNFLRAAGELLDKLTEAAQLAGEVSCIYKRGGRLIGHAVDPEASRRALSLILPENHWQKSRAEILCLGAGGSAAAMLVGLLTQPGLGSLPQRVTFVDREPSRLAGLQALVPRLPRKELVIDFRCTASAAENDQILNRLPAGSLVINATGMGKDRPGSPVGPQGVFPAEGVVWDLNYRGELVFLDQARSRAAERRLTVADGWDLFVIGWALAIERVFEVDALGPVYRDLKAAAEAAR